VLFLDDIVKNAINREGERAYPDECCGVMLGRLSETGDDRTVLQILPIINARLDGEAYHRFLITPEDMMGAEKKARGLSLDVLGFYHSHPDHPAKPSEYDLEHAMPFYSYVITAVEKGVAGDTASWRLGDDRAAFGEEDIGGVE
jgi:proteasome lid subunit RPN8/RPN11